MIRSMARCPYCHQCEVAYDWHTEEVVFNPDGVRQEPCEHLAYLNGAFCQWELLPNGNTRVGLSSFFWHHAGFAGTDIQQVFRGVMEVVAATPIPEPFDPEQPFQAQRICIEEDVTLPRPDVVALLDEVGWENNQDDRLAPHKYRLNGWIVFAADAAKFVAAVLAAIPRPVPIRKCG